MANNEDEVAQVSLWQELLLLRHTMEGAQILLSELSRNRIDSSPDEFKALLSSKAILSLVGARLRLVESVVRGDTDPDLIFASWNETDIPISERDICLKRWSREERVARFGTGEDA